jgi:hypothetical protein
MISYIRERESVNRSQMDIKRKTCDIWAWKKHSFFDRPSTNIDIFVPSLYLRAETRSIEVFWILYQPLSHLVGHHLRLSNVLERISWPYCEPLYATDTSHRKHDTFLLTSFAISLSVHKSATERSSSVLHSSSTVAILTTETSLWTCACASPT